MDEILREARQWYDAIRDLECPPELQPSKLWLDNTRKSIAAAASWDSVTELIRYVQENNLFTPGRLVDEPMFDEIIEKHKAWLRGQGHPVSSFDPMVQESHLASPRVCVSQAGRTLSADFLCYLCICTRILDGIRDPILRVLEIGGGYGGLARVFKLLQPSAQYWMLDLPESLFYSYAFIRANFPDAKCRVISSTKQEEIKGSGKDVSPDEADFIFVPISLVECLSGRFFDVAINTCSLGEMTQSAVGCYFRLIEEQAQTKYFYSLNRYGQLPQPRIIDGVLALAALARTSWGHWAIGDDRVQILNVERLKLIPRTAGPGSCDYATPFDPYWSVLLWKAHGRESFSQIDPVRVPKLECLVKRIPKYALSTSYRKYVAESLLQEAIRKGAEDRHEWEYLMWQSVRIFPFKENLVPWLEFLEKGHYDEHAYFKRVYDNL